MYLLVLHNVYGASVDTKDKRTHSALCCNFYHKSPHCKYENTWSLLKPWYDRIQQSLLPGFRVIMLMIERYVFSDNGGQLETERIGNVDNKIGNLLTNDIISLCYRRCGCWDRRKLLCIYGIHNRSIPRPILFKYIVINYHVGLLIVESILSTRATIITPYLWVDSK